MKKIRIMVCIILCMIVIVACGKDPSTITDEDLSEAINSYYIEMDNDALELFELVGIDRTCQYFEEKIKKYASSTNYNAELVSFTIDDYKFVYDKYYSEPNLRLDELERLNRELSTAIQCQSEIYKKYSFCFYECVGDIQNQSMYISNRIESSSDDNLLGWLEQTFDSYTEEGSYWATYNVLYDSWLGSYPGDDVYILYSYELNPFSTAGVHSVWYYTDGKKLAVEDTKGFQKEIPVLYMVLESDYWSFVEAQDVAYNMVAEINKLFGVDNSLDNNVDDVTNNTGIPEGLIYDDVEIGNVAGYYQDIEFISSLDCTMYSSPEDEVVGKVTIYLESACMARDGELIKVRDNVYRVNGGIEEDMVIGFYVYDNFVNAVLYIDGEYVQEFIMQSEYIS